MSTLANATIEGKILDTTGPIFVERNGKTIELKIDDPIYEADVITTGADTTADILYRDGTKSRLAPNTKFALTDYEFGEGDNGNSFLIDLTQGAVRTVTGEIVKLNPEGFEIVTPRATVGIRGTEALSSVDPISGGEVHAVYFIDNGSIMLVQGADGNSVSLDSPLQVTQFNAGSPSPTGVANYTLAQMESTINGIAPTLATDIPQSAAQEGAWASVQQVLIDTREQEDDEEQEENQNTDEQVDEGDPVENAVQEALENAPEPAQTIVIVASEEDALQISELIEELEELGFEVEIVDPLATEGALAQLQTTTTEAIKKPDLNNAQPAENILAFDFGNYTGGNLTGKYLASGESKEYTPGELAALTEDVYLHGIQIINTSKEEDLLTLTTGSGDDIIVVGATYDSGSNSYTDLSNSSFIPLEGVGDTEVISVAVANAQINTGSGDDTIYLNHSSSEYASDRSKTMSDSQINMGEGNDSLFIKGQGVYGSYIDLGNGNNYANLMTTVEGSTITAGSGNDTIIVSGSPVSPSTYNLGAGNDILTFTESSKDNIDMGAGDDTINFNMYSAESDNNITLGAGNDTVNLNGLINTYSVTLDLGTGNNRVNINGAYGNSYTNLTFSGDGNNTITATSNIASDVTFTSGAGNDNYYISSSINNASVTFDTGEGNDSIILQNVIASANVTINTGDDNDFVRLNGAVGSNTTIQGGSLGEGNDVFVISQQGSTNIGLGGGDGNDLLVGMEESFAGEYTDAGYKAYLQIDPTHSSLIQSLNSSQDLQNKLGITLADDGIKLSDALWDFNSASGEYEYQGSETITLHKDSVTVSII